MVGFDLTEEQYQMQALARKFTEKEIKPIASQIDHLADYRDSFQWGIVDKLDMIGFRTMALAKKYGGPEMSVLTATIVLEELAAGDLGVAYIIQQTTRYIQALQWSGTEEQCRTFLIPLRDDSRGLIAMAGTEAEFGSDAVTAYPKPRIITTAVLDGDGWVINGVKQWSLGGAYARFFFVGARTEQGLSLFLAPSDTPGIKVGHIHDEVGGRLFPRAEIIFDNVRLPKENIIQAPLEKRNPASRANWTTWVYPSACALGVGRAAYEAALEYAKTRVQGGKRIIEHQAIGNMLADMYISLESARLLIWKVAWTADHYEYGDPGLAAMTKFFSAEVAMKVAVQALEIHGGYGGTKDLPMEKYVRDAISLLFASGTEQALKLTTANFLDQG